ncbi:MAG: hypothetical protein ACK56I_31750, partial [bacterium]
RGAPAGAERLTHRVPTRDGDGRQRSGLDGDPTETLSKPRRRARCSAQPEEDERRRATRREDALVAVAGDVVRACGSVGGAAADADPRGGAVAVAVVREDADADPGRVHRIIAASVE